MKRAAPVMMSVQMALFEEPTIAGLAESMVAREVADADAELLAQLLAELE